MRISLMEIIIIGLIVAAYFWYKNASKANQRNNYDDLSVDFQKYRITNHPSKSVFSFPTDAYELTTKFAKLISDIERSMPWSVNGEFTKGRIFFGIDQNQKEFVSLWYDKDDSTMQSVIEEKYTFDSGISFYDSGKIQYESHSITGLKTWCYSDVTQSFFADGIIATLQNNCNSIRILDQNCTNQSVSVGFRVVKE